MNTAALMEIRRSMYMKLLVLMSLAKSSLGTSDN